MSAQQLVMKRAWAIARTLAAKLGGKPKEYFHATLKMAWDEFKQGELMETTEVVNVTQDFTQPLLNPVLENLAQEKANKSFYGYSNNTVIELRKEMQRLYDLHKELTIEYITEIPIAYAQAGDEVVWSGDTRRSGYAIKVAKPIKSKKQVNIYGTFTSIEDTTPSAHSWQGKKYLKRDNHVLFDDLDRYNEIQNTRRELGIENDNLTEGELHDEQSTATATTERTPPTVSSETDRIDNGVIASADSQTDSDESRHIETVSEPIEPATCELPVPVSIGIITENHEWIEQEAEKFMNVAELKNQIEVLQAQLELANEHIKSLEEDNAELLAQLEARRGKRNKPIVQQWLFN